MTHAWCPDCLGFGLVRGKFCSCEAGKSLEKLKRDVGTVSAARVEASRAREIDEKLEGLR